MENIIWKTDSCKMYMKFDNNIDESTPTPCAFFVIGVEYKLLSGIGGELLCRAEDSFSMLSGRFLSDLGRLINSYEPKQLRIQDDLADTDGYILFDCKPSCIEVSGQLGSLVCRDIMLKFSFTADASLLLNLYEVLEKNTIY